MDSMVLKTWLGDDDDATFYFKFLALEYEVDDLWLVLI